MAWEAESDATLDKYAIGEIAELTGVADYYDAGASKWLKTATYVAASALTAASKALLAASAAPVNVLAFGSNLALTQNLMPFANLPVCRLSGSSISVLPAGTSVYGTSVVVGTVTSSGLQAVPTGQVSLAATSISGQVGNNVAVTNDGTNFWAWTFTGANAVSAYKSTSGTSFANQALSGLPTFSATSSGKAWPSGDQLARGVAGDNLLGNATENWLFFHCGARHLVIGPGATNYLASRTTTSTGATFNGDETNTVLGTTSLAKTVARWYFHQNGNNCYLAAPNNTVHRWTNDGGVTWAASTTPPADSTTLRYKKNASNAAKLCACNTSSTSAYFTNDTGATWTARTLPANLTTEGWAYVGSTCVLLSGGVVYTSTDDGATWAAQTLPVGLNATPTCAAGDANRFYLGTGTNPQFLTSTNGTSWTLRACPTGLTFVGIVAMSSNNVGLFNASNMMATNDGGVTWTIAALDTTARSIIGGDAYTTPDGSGYGFLGGTGPSSANQCTVATADFTALGSYYRTGSTAVTPLRANASAYMRVA